MWQFDILEIDIMTKFDNIRQYLSTLVRILSFSSNKKIFRKGVLAHESPAS